MPAHRRSVPTTSRALALAVGIALALGACATSGEPRADATGPTTPKRSDRSTTTAATCAQPGLPVTVAYRSVPGVPADDTSVDVHAPKGACGVPVVVWVHGGGYRLGDKSQQVADKVTLFNDAGWILVSVNYRLTVVDEPGSAHFPDHYEDVAAAIAWVHDRIGAYGGDPSRLAVLGHSAGADIVANVTARPTYLAAHDLQLADITCAGTFDTAGFDKTALAETADEYVQWTEALGNHPGFARDTSATLLLRPGTGVPATINVVRGSPLRRRIEHAYTEALEASGARTVEIDASSLTHAQVNQRIGAAGDTVMTPPLLAFLRDCFAR